jgi:lysophospholipase L1-like esterase
MPPTRRELILAAVVLIALPAFADLVLRISGVQFEPQLYEPSRDRGWTLRAGASGVVSAENRQAVHINSHGCRDRERSYEKPEGTVRIAVLGNSWTEALQVPLEKTYPAVLESHLQEQNCFNGRRIEVLNFGVAGYSTGQELLALQQEVWKYKPDVVLLAFYSARDIANNIRELNNAANPEQSPYYVYRNGELVEDAAFRELPMLQPRQIELQEMQYGLNDHAKLLQAVNALQRGAKLRLATATVKERAERFGVENLEYSIYAPPSSDQMEQAWRVTEGLLVKMRGEVKARGAEFRVVVLATRPQVLPDPEKRAELRRKLGVKDFSYADQKLQEFGAKENIPVTLLSPALSAYAETHRVYLNGFNESNWGKGHWNEAGHRLAAEAIAADLCNAAMATGEAGQE